MDNDDTNRLPKPPYPDGLEVKTNKTDTSVAGESDDTSDEDSEIYSVCSSQSERDMGGLERRIIVIKSQNDQHGQFE